MMDRRNKKIVKIKWIEIKMKKLEIIMMLDWDNNKINSLVKKIRNKQDIKLLIYLYLICYDVWYLYEHVWYIMHNSRT